MPIMPKDKVQQSDLYGMTQVESGLSMRERIKRRFRPTDTVEVHNITDQRVQWQWLDEQNESYTIEDDTNIKIVDREDPDLWYLDGGEKDVLIGANAFMMIEALYKQVCVLKTGIVINPQSEREVRNFSIDDPERQEQFIDLVFKRKLAPQDMYRAALHEMGGTGEPEVIQKMPSLATEREEMKRRMAGNSLLQQKPRVAAESKELSDLADEFDPGSTLLGTATGGLPEDRRQPEETETEEKPAVPKANAKKEKTAAPAA